MEWRGVFGVEMRGEESRGEERSRVDWVKWIGVEWSGEESIFTWHYLCYKNTKPNLLEF